MLNPEVDLKAIASDRPSCMKSMIISVLSTMPGYKGDIREIKKKMLEKFGDRLAYDSSYHTRADSNLQQWEKTILKTIARHKGIFFKNKALFSLQSSSS